MSYARISAFFAECANPSPLSFVVGEGVSLAGGAVAVISRAGSVTDSTARVSAGGGSTPSPTQSPLDVHPGNVWTYAQNKPSLVIEDLAAYGVPRSITARILMARGVFKWLACRRDLIRLKDAWRDELTGLYRAIERGDIRRGTPEYFEARGRLKALQECRAGVRSICHSERWRAPDFDQAAMDHVRASLACEGALPNPWLGVRYW